MKINDVNRAGMLNPYRKAIDAQAAGSTGKTARQKDGVEFSPEARKMLEASGDPTQASRIEELKEAVSTGTYRIEAEKVAEKMVSYWLGGDN